MKWSHVSGIRRIELVCTVALVLISLYCARVLAVTSDIRRRQAYSAALGDRIEVRPATLTCDLPDGWEADWRGELLWITHYNSDRTVADALAFGSLEGLYDWVEAHPDFCDVDVDRLMLHRPDATVDATTTEFEATTPTAADLHTVMAVE